MSRGKIITRYIRPPIPTTDFDWAAFYEEEEENPRHVGWGATEQEALEDLKRSFE